MSRKLKMVCMNMMTMPWTLIMTATDNRSTTR